MNQNPYKYPDQNPYKYPDQNPYKYPPELISKRRREEHYPPIDCPKNNTCCAELADAINYIKSLGGEWPRQRQEDSEQTIKM